MFEVWKILLNICVDESKFGLFEAWEYFVKRLSLGFVLCIRGLGIVKRLYEFIYEGLYVQGLVISVNVQILCIQSLRMF